MAKPEARGWAWPGVEAGGECAERAGGLARAEGVARSQGGRGLVRRRHWPRKQRAGETTGAGQEGREAQGGQEERLEVEPQEIRGAPGGRDGERMWRGRWRYSGWKQRAGSGRTARARGRPRGSWGGAGEGVGRGGAKPGAVKGDEWGHREPWSWADPRTPSIPLDAWQGCSPSLLVPLSSPGPALPTAAR